MPLRPSASSSGVTMMCRWTFRLRFSISVPAPGPFCALWAPSLCPAALHPAPGVQAGWACYCVRRRSCCNSAPWRAWRFQIVVFFMYGNPPSVLGTRANMGLLTKYLIGIGKPGKKERKNALWRQSAFRINLLRFNATAERGQRSSATSFPL